MATDEDSKLHPTSVYGISKQTQEQMFMAVGRALDIPTVALRYQNVYGPGQSLQNPYTGILSIFSTRMRNGAPIAIFEDGKESRDFVYIGDVVEATRLAMEKDAADFEVFNVGSGVKTDVLIVAHTLRSALGCGGPIEVSGKFRIGDIRDNFADIAKIRNRLGFIPKTSFIEGISRFADWVKTQSVPRGSFSAKRRRDAASRAVSVSELAGKRILFIGIGFYDYEASIVARLRQCGAIVQAFFDRPAALRNSMLANSIAARDYRYRPFDPAA